MGRVPFLRLLRYPGLFLAVCAAAAILAAVSAAGAPFLSATSSATLHRTIEADARFRVPALTISADGSITADVIDYRTSLLERELGPFLGEPIVTARGDTVSVSRGRPQREVRIVTRTGALEHVEVLEDAGIDGVWLADVTARDLGVVPGDRVRIENAFGRADAVVAGIYRDLLTEARTPFWAPLDDFIYPPPDANLRPPPFMLMDLATYVSIEGRLLDDQDAFSWEFRLPTGPLSDEEAQALSSRLARFRAAMSNSTLDVGTAFRRSNEDEPFSGWLSSTEEISDAVAGPVNALALAGRGVALVVLAGSGLFMVRRRRVELEVLHARGVGPLRLGARTVAEVALPVAIGAVVGWAVALAAVAWLGSGGVVAEGALRDAAVGVAWMSLVAVILLGLVAARSIGEPNARPVLRATTWVPWDLILLVLAGVSFVGLRAQPGPASARAAPELDPLFLLFPVLLLAGASGFISRGARAVLPQLRRVGSGWGAGGYLALRRLAAAPRLATSLIVASSVAVGILVYAGALTSSLAESATQSAALSVGGEVSVGYSGSLSVADDTSVPMTPIVRIERASFASASVAQLDVLLVEPSTFVEGAFWRDEFADVSLEVLMQRLAEPADAGIPVVVAGGVRVPADPVLSTTGITVPVRVVGIARTFPGIVGDRPLVVMDRVAMERAAEASGLSIGQLADAYEVWARGGEEEARSAVASRGATVLTSASAEEVRQTPRYLAVSAMLRFLQALGILAALVVLIGGHLYLQTRQRQVETSYALARRMGLARASHRRSIALEVAGLLGTAFVIGASIAAFASLVVNEDVQARAVDAAVPLFRLPVLLLVVTAAALLLFAWAGSALVQRRADRADVAEVMRVAE